MQTLLTFLWAIILKQNFYFQQYYDFLTSVHYQYANTNDNLPVFCHLCYFVSRSYFRKRYSTHHKDDKTWTSLCSHLVSLFVPLITCTKEKIYYKKITQWLVWENVTINKCLAYRSWMLRKMRQSLAEQDKSVEYDQNF